VAKIPVMRPKLPAAESLLPYLQAIDSSRIYSNFGPLTRQLEERLAQHFGLEAGTVATVGNATLGLTLALMAQGAKPGTLCVMPAWTFVASAHAATMAGLVPFFVDVDPVSWALDPDRIGEAVASVPGEVGSVMPVAPYGSPIDIAAWDAFRQRSALPVVIDAAAGFDALVPGAVPAVVSLHATKVFGIGEGGLVVSTDTALVQDIIYRSNFGFAGTREAAMPGGNAKLSEYHAAVGLAALDQWTEVRAEWMAMAKAYRGALPESNALRFQDGFGESWIGTTCILQATEPFADRLEKFLADAGIETRRWWGHGAHAHKATTAFPRTALPVTDMLARTTTSVPFFRGLATAEIQRICGTVSDAIRA
jgi:dTDP-4-amino-4,6-dideoxygalactose transaminase